MKRVLLIGSGGAGKSTLARKMSKQLNITAFHLDKLLWKPNWQMTPKPEQAIIVNNLVRQDIRVAAADTIVFLDRSRFVCIYQVFKRLLQYRGTSRPDMQDDCPEKIDWDFLKWIWQFPNKQKVIIMNMFETIDQSKNIVILKNKKQIEKFFDQL
ncbi:ATPase AAA [Leuconostoc mesenteroides subsp. dextranicum]|jgi:adenylate kinase family enzyme|uniref:AAA family ATPase n=1 Tax=Leuconostoc mesenteroides TaxID=1245 RepID=UPI000680F50B|nr:AAA family ATPase [Leuconostoc mesenteroides]KMY77811.1 ATPase AAA [Leuconostoc mesenteroides subsp. mesenteroides]KMY81321.1 ATPase AAA [Leuconostoc mesenteroides subsp. dextranicum]MBZ1502782.1 AAA family ATPase [Leuconostoc mesenteroides]MBZ1506409.1 AAA family ATPase [Leuconostoc mesenteroides]MCH3953223.1 AAA family ATPase [Leuconostoc mesenteroides]